MRDFPSKLSKHIEESLIIIEDVNAGGTAPLRRGENSIRYQRWRLHTGKDIPPQSELRHFRSLYITGTHGPLTIEIPGRKHSPARAFGPSQWDYVTLVTDLLWKGTWTGVAPADQPGLVVIRPDGGVVLSATPPESRPALCALLAHPLLTTHEIAAACDEMGARAPTARERSAYLALWVRQGLLLPAPEWFTKLHAEITRPGESRPSGRQATVYLSVPAYALAVADAQIRERWDSDPAAAIRKAMGNAAQEVHRSADLIKRLESAGW